MKPVVRVTVTDLETGEKQMLEIADDYIVVVAGSHHIDGIQSYGNGTTVVTIKSGRAVAIPPE